MNSPLQQQLIKKEFQLDAASIHGIRHWENVFKIGVALACHTKADTKVVGLFSWLHDIKRETDDYDPKHGLRAGKLIKDLYDKKLLNISQKQLSQLLFACKYHNHSSIKSSDITVQTCWDADRLDLWRLGEVPDKNLLNTKIAKSTQMICFAKALNN